MPLCGNLSIQLILCIYWSSTLFFKCELLSFYSFFPAQTWLPAQDSCTTYVHALSGVIKICILHMWMNMEIE